MSAPNAHDRPAGRVVAAYAVYGAFAGTLVFSIEAVDRLRVLRQNLFGAGEAARLVLLLAATILLVAIASAIAGVVWTEMDPSGGWKAALGKELKAAGHEIDWNRVMR